MELRGGMKNVSIISGSGSLKAMIQQKVGEYTKKGSLHA